MLLNVLCSLDTGVYNAVMHWSLHKQLQRKKIMFHSAWPLCVMFACLSMLVWPLSAPAREVDPGKGKLDEDGKTVWFDAQDLLVVGKGWTDTNSFYERLPARAQGRVIQPVWDLRRNTAGLNVRFSVDARSVKARWTLVNTKDLAMIHMPATGVSGVDLYARDKDGKWRFVNNGKPQGETNTASFGLQTVGTECMLYLPLYNGVTSVQIGIPRDAKLTVPDEASLGKPIVFYGTSITQGACASRPGMAATAIVGRALDMPVINLGFSGSGVMELSMAELISEVDASAYVLDCLWNMRPEQVTERTVPFVKILRQKHPDTPIYLVEDSSVWGFTPTAKGKLLRAEYQKLKAGGVKNVYFISNEGMLGDDTEGTVDTTHPNDLGMMRQAQVFIRELSQLQAR